MPIISKETHSFLGSQYIQTIKVLKDGLFRISLPPMVVNVLGKKEAVAETMDLAKQIHRELLNDFKSARTTTKKVIRYRVKYYGTVWNDDKTRVILNENSIPFSNRPNFHECLTVGISAGVYRKSTISLPGGGTRDTYTLLPSDEQFAEGIATIGNASWMCEGYREMDWTPDRHEFFDRLCESMAQLIWGLHHMAKDDESLIGNIESGRFLESL